jgi:Zn-dependent protease with chaperone function
MNQGYSKFLTPSTLDAAAHLLDYWRSGHRGMKRLYFGFSLLLLAGCVTRFRSYWNVRELVLSPAPVIDLATQDSHILLSVDKRTLQKLFLSHVRIARAANVQAELVLVDGDEPNAFAALIGGRRAVAINLGMVKLIGADDDEFAALLGHETAHWAKGHVDSGRTRSSTIQGLGTLVGAGLGMAGVPAAGLISGLSADIIESSFSRDDEREADAWGIDYMTVAGSDPWAAVRLHEKMLALPRGVRIPFLSSHPSGQERIENLKQLIETKRLQIETGRAPSD